MAGRSDISKDENGVVTGHYGDDLLPTHMRHVQQNQAEYPKNTGAFPPNRDSDRPAKIGGSNVKVGKHPVTGKELVKDEKPPNIHKIPGGQNHGTTMQGLPRLESVGRDGEDSRTDKVRARCPERPEATDGRPAGQCQK